MGDPWWKARKLAAVVEQILVTGDTAATAESIWILLNDTTDAEAAVATQLQRAASTADRGRQLSRRKQSGAKRR